MASLYVPSRIGSPTGNGYKLFFYQTGTTTPQDTFSQSDLAPGHENTNPVVADANGLFGPIYLLASPDYKAVLEDATGTTIWTTDPLLTAAASVITTEGDLIVGDSSGNAVRLPIGSAAEYLRSDGTTEEWHVLDAADLNGTVAKLAMPPGAIIQSVISTTNAYTSHTTIIPFDDTIPQNTEGDEILTASITPTSTSTKVRVSCLINHDSGSLIGVIALFRAAGANAIAAAASYITVDNLSQISLSFEDVPGSVAAQNYSLRYGPGGGGTVYINGVSGGRIFGGTLVSAMRLDEIAV